MPRSRVRRMHVPYRNDTRGEMEELAARSLEIQREQHAANARRSARIGFAVTATCIALVVWRLLVHVGAGLGSILAHGFGGG